ncbi:MAG: mechanosensitive ion channel family protein [Anaerolineae bacterium]|jgi:small-conductance mechanosensitive channel|nr:mechanosensitive ion channel family protein [Anaerolineae bacterium]MBT7069941.1 mechanosensitive ion channel family protein [Anaerolineae bacterium]MBT7325652.1 mechanosensitive ion channel family protein [Anaerolineae bacterium]
MIDNLFIFSNNLLNALFVAVLGILVAFVLGEALRRLLRGLLGDPFAYFAANLLRLAVAIWTIKIILDISGAAGLAVILVTVLTGAFALGSERFASDILAGVKLFTTRPYTVGDHVSLGTHEGKVSEITLANTILQGVYGDHILIRNADVMDNTIINYSLEEGRMISVLVPLPTGEDLEIAFQSITEELKNFSDMKNPPYTPSVTCEEISYGYAKLQVRAFVKEKLDHGPDKARLMIEAVAALKKNGIALKN